MLYSILFQHKESINRLHSAQISGIFTLRIQTRWLAKDEDVFVLVPIQLVIKRESQSYYDCLDCEESLVTEWMLYNQAPSSLCSVVNVDLYGHRGHNHIYSICSGACSSQNLTCSCQGQLAGVRYLLCDGIQGM